jgi:nucleotide-binding universal stress UspA family protein
MKKILVGVDGSSESKAAAEAAADIAQAYGAHLLVTYVTPPRPVRGMQAMGDEKWDIAEQEYAAGLLEEMERRCQREGVRVETMTASGAIADTLAQTAGAWADLVVVGHRGRGAVQRMLLGSVADQLVQISPKPVLIVR